MWRLVFTISAYISVSQLAARHLDIKRTRNSNEVSGIFRPLYDRSIGRCVPVSYIPFLVIFLNYTYDFKYNRRVTKKCIPNVASHSKWSILLSRGLGSSSGHVVQGRIVHGMFPVKFTQRKQSFRYHTITQYHLTPTPALLPGTTG